MHIVVVRRDLLETHPWIAASLIAAFDTAKRTALQRLYYLGAPKGLLPLLHAEVEETRAIFGEDPWPDGVAPNRPTLERLLNYMIEDGVIPQAPTLEALFPYAA
jgi:4,5-dihydroxyphthalate decarboxylase